MDPGIRGRDMPWDEVLEERLHESSCPHRQHKDWQRAAIGLHLYTDQMKS